MLFWPASRVRLDVVASLRMGVSNDAEGALKRVEPAIRSAFVPIYPGIAAISPLVPTSAIMRLML